MYLNRRVERLETEIPQAAILVDSLTDTQIGDRISLLRSILDTAAEEKAIVDSGAEVPAELHERVIGLLENERALPRILVPGR